MGAVKGWTPDGQEVELAPWQANAVRALLDRRSWRTVIVARGRACGWSTVLATAARLDAEGADPGAPDLVELREWARCQEMRDGRWPAVEHPGPKGSPEEFKREEWHEEYAKRNAAKTDLVSRHEESAKDEP